MRKGTFTQSIDSETDNTSSPEIMPKSIVLLSCVLALASTPVWAQTQNPTPQKIQTITLKCQSRGFKSTVVISSNLTYTATTLAGGSWVGNPSTSAVRFKNGGLQNKSIVYTNQKYYLVATASEAKAAQLAQVDAAIVCKI
jgi:hypothetical protein